MIQRPLSIFRGYSAYGGIGETPKAVPGTVRGGQYLYADQELWNDEVANAARRWMTLYDDQRIAEISYKIGQNLEAWSYFGHGELRFVARLVAAGTFDSHSAYFSHAQAWHIRDFHDGDDPGALLGDSRVFHPAWKDGQAFQSVEPTEPGAVWKPAVEAKVKLAVRLVAYLYRACITGIPVTVGIPFREFVIGGSIHQLVCFARAALPLELKRDCRIRIFTGRPEAYLRDLKAHLVVVPEELASAAIASRSDVLLDFAGDQVAGVEADPAYTRYAKEVVERVLRFPESLLDFAGRYKCSLDGPPDEAGVASVSVVYNFAYANKDAAKLDSLLVFVAGEARKRTHPLDWGTLIRPEEWRQFSNDLLIEIAISDWPTEDMRALRRCVKQELSRRGFKFTEEQVATLMQGTPEAMRTIEAWELVEYDLVAVPPPALEISAGEQWRSLLSRAGMETRYLRFLHAQAARWVEQHSVPSWLSEQDLLPAATKDMSAPNLENYLNWTEALALLKSKEARLRVRKLTELENREERRRLFQLWKQNRWKVLQDFVRPESWARDVDDLRVEVPEELQRLDTEHLLQLQPQEQPLHPNLVKELDERMRLDPRATTKRLLAADYWLRWRLASHLASRRDSAREWLFQSPNHPRLEEWKLVIADLQVETQSEEGRIEFGITGADMRRLRKRFKRQQLPCPQIAAFTREQAEDLAQVCADFEALAEFAEAVNSGEPRYVQVLQKSVFSQTFPMDTLAWLAATPANPPKLTLAQAEHLVHLSGGRRSRALVPLSLAVTENLLEHLEEATTIGDRTELWNETVFQAQLVHFLRDQRLQPSDPAQRRILEILDRKIPALTSLAMNRDRELAPLAQVYWDNGLRRLAEFLWPTVGSKAPTSWPAKPHRRGSRSSGDNS